jgi:D-alanyl-D-alanine carboxypeptidase/D-alanyl-D-alanine-endopeptidase (penicillin-binding protein 4)
VTRQAAPRVGAPFDACRELKGHARPAARRRILADVLRATVLAIASLTPQAHAVDDLPPAVTAELDRAMVPRDAVVAMVQEVGGVAAPLLAWQVAKPVAPASLMKVVTTYAALELLGPAYRWNTPVWLQGTVRNGVLHGDLVIKGTGDPTLVMERVWLMLRRVQQLGVREIRGDIVLDRSVFTLPEQDPAEFDGQPLRPYNVQPDALLLDFKSVALTFTPDVARRVAVVSADPPLHGVRVDATVPLDSAACQDWYGTLRADFTDPDQLRFTGAYPVACGARTWTIAYADPGSFDERSLMGLWREMGGRISGSVRAGTAPSTTPTFESTSRSLAEVVRDIDKFSNNVMARQLFLTLGVHGRGSGSLQASRQALQQWATERFGSAADAMVLDNGSGLSRDARVNALLLARLLQRAWQGFWMSELMSALPIAGIDGTLANSSIAPGRAHLKTGTLRDASGLAGYVLANSGRRFVVVVIANHPNAPAARPAFEALVQWAVND